MMYAAGLTVREIADRFGGPLISEAVDSGN